MKKVIVSTVVMFLSFSSGALAGKLRTGKGPCKQPSQCKRNLCLEVNGQSYCSQSCGRCPAGMYCDKNLFGMLGLSVCVKGSQERPVKPEALPRIPCRADTDCLGALVCAQKMGMRDCTRECSADADCATPEMMGVKIDFYECSFDEGKRGRRACLPKDSCLENPMSCMKMNPAAVGQMVGGMAAMGAQMEHSAEASFGGGALSVSAQATVATAPPSHDGPMAMSGGRFASFLRQIRNNDFWDERKAVIESAAERNYFTCDQLGRILDVLEFSSERIAAIKIIAPRLVDRENSFQVLEHLEFDSDKQQARKILAK